MYIMHLLPIHHMPYRRTFHMHREIHVALHLILQRPSLDLLKVLARMRRGKIAVSSISFRHPLPVNSRYVGLAHQRLTELIVAMLEVLDGVWLTSGDL